MNDVVVSALIAGLFLLLGTVAGAFLTRKQSTQENLERYKREDEVRWLDVKRQLYTDLMGVLSRLHRATLRAWQPDHTATLRQDTRVDLVQTALALQNEATNTVEAVSIIAEENLIAKARDARNKLFDVARSAIGDTPTDKRGSFGQAYQKAHLAIDGVRAAIRQELKIDSKHDLTPTTPANDSTLAMQQDDHTPEAR